MLSYLGENAKKTIPVSWDVILKQAVERYEKIIENYKEDNRLK